MNANEYQQICWSCMNKYVGIETADGHATMVLLPM